MTELLYQTDAYLREFHARVTAVEQGAVALDRTALYATGGGQPHDTGTLGDGARVWRVAEVRKQGDAVWHTLAGEGLPDIGAELRGSVDWERRYKLMRTHTALHLLCGVIWRDYKAPVTGGNMDTDEGRLDFELPNFSNELAQEIVARVNDEIAAARPVEVRILPRAEAFQIPDLIRTKINLLPEGIQQVRTVNIVGLDLQADGGTHVANTREVGRVTLLKTRSKGANNKRIVVAIE
ncbi:MAG TPA: alanyl-tRNA editing protein [Kouleothrix sp.]|uniref:alanyl-tRNA editing protein n=1 Tax=Kouleothrix sp. TaxID=2779161 RepID=UPI002C0A0BA0|nr:alanyl-tRNA editing protein [Kouleothrix sp.]